jgi:four helix bundle protein
VSQSPLFAKTHDLTLWLIQKTSKFPREHRFVTARFVQEAVLNFQAYIIEAAAWPRQDTDGKLARLHKADVELTKLRYHLRLCRDLGLLDPGPHRHVSQMVDEIGRLLGGWFKALGQQHQAQPIDGLPQ